MISWAISHSPYVGVFVFGYCVGVVRAAVIQLRRERERRDFDRWMRKQRTV